jgi:hypothetical protein
MSGHSSASVIYPAQCTALNVGVSFLGLAGIGGCEVNITSSKRIAIRNQTGAPQSSGGLEIIPPSATLSTTVAPGECLIVPISKAVIAVPDWLAATQEFLNYATGYGQPASYFDPPPAIEIF